MTGSARTPSPSGDSPSLPSRTTARVTTVIDAEGDVITPAAVGGVPDGVTFEPGVVTYAISGRTFDELQAAMRRDGPIVGGARVQAATDWDATWRYRYRSNATRCAVTQATVRVVARVTMPVWTPPADADPRLVTVWRSYRERIWRHELQHVRHALDAGGDLVAALPTLAATTCAEVDAQVQATGERVRAKHVARDAKIDEPAARRALMDGIVPPGAR